MPDATPIPDEEVWEGSQRLVIGPPAGMDVTGNVRPVEALVDQGSLGRRFSTRWVFTEEEIVRLSLGDPVYLVVNAPQMVPVALSFLEPVEVAQEIPPPWNACPSCGKPGSNQAPLTSPWWHCTEHGAYQVQGHPKCAVCGLEIEWDGDGWGHVAAAEPPGTPAWDEFWEKGCADPRPEEGG